MNSVDVLSGVLSVFALLLFYFGCQRSHQQLIQKMALRMVVVSLIGGIFLTLWCGFFYALMDFPLKSVRPWEIFPFVLASRDFGFLVNVKLWALPFALASLGIALKIAPFMKPSWSYVYGNAHFATMPEIKKMNLFQKEGVLVGKKNGKYLRYGLTNHLLVFAPSRSGKGVSLVIPNALEWNGSLLVIDNKYEIFKATSGFRRAQGQHVFRFSPASEACKTHRINPLDYVDKKNRAKAITDLHLILDILIVNAGGDNHMWAEEARSISLGILLWLMQSDRPFDLSELASIIKGGQELDVFLQKIINEHTLADNLITLEPAAFLAIQNFLQKAPKEQSGVRSTLTSMVRLWEDPLICAATRASDVDFRDMRKHPITLYLSFGTDQISRLSPLINLIVQLFLNVMLKSLPDEKEPYKVLCLLDEINRFGRMDKLRDGFGDLAGYGVHLMPIIQNVGQFYTIYGGRDQTDIFFQNTDLKVVFRQNAETDKQFVSKALGNKTVRIKNRSYHSGRPGSNYSESLIERPLLSPKEVGEFPKNKQLLILGDGVVCAKKIIYYQDRYFKSKLMPSIEIPSVKLSFPTITVTKKIPESLLMPEAPNPPPIKKKKMKKSEESLLLKALSKSFEDEGR